MKCSSCGALTLEIIATPEHKRVGALLRAGMAAITLVPSDKGGCVAIVDGVQVWGADAAMALRNLAWLTTSPP